MVILLSAAVDDLGLDTERERELLEVTNAGVCLIIYTGIALGPVWFSTIARDEPPSTTLTDSMTGWEVGQEVDMLVNDDITMMDLTCPAGFEGVVLAPSRPGLHRVRVLARGRSGHYDHVVRKATEEYELTIWPTEGAEDPEVCGNPVPY